jgi:hypothetical protein
MNKDVLGGLAWASAIIAIALGATLARKMGLMDGDAVTRLVIGINGLMIAWYGNRMPKAFVPSVAARQAARIGGWSMVISGLVYAAVWAFAPIQTAVFVGCGAILLGIAVTTAYCLSQRRRAAA